MHRFHFTALWISSCKITSLRSRYSVPFGISGVRTIHNLARSLAIGRNQVSTLTLQYVIIETTLRTDVHVGTVSSPNSVSTGRSFQICL